MWGLGLVAVVAAITGVLACRQLVGITDSPPEDLFVRRAIEQAIDQLGSVERKVLGDESVPSRRASCRGTVT
jgi:hypothetical protein